MTGFAWCTAAGVFALAFLLGSVPWGVIISKLFYKRDLRDFGSGNIGTTNAMRTLGKVGGAAVFVLDFGKGVGAGLIGWGIAQWLLSGPEPLNAYQTVSVMTATAFLGCTFGHIFSPWLDFKGGKGIAVAIGCLFVTFGAVGSLLEILVFAILVLTTRYVSVGSIAAAVACPIIATVPFHGCPFAWACCLLVGVTVIWAHRANIARLRRGCESRIGSKKSKPSS